MIMHEKEMMKREERLTKEELFKNYEEAQKDDIGAVVLFIQMPTGEVEAITNPNVEAKMQYVDKTYDENLVHKNCKDIFILDCVFCDNSDTFDFGYALEIIKEGRKAARKGWNAGGQYITYFNPYDEGFVEPENVQGTWYPFLAIKTNYNGLVPWFPSQTDVLAEDWYELEAYEMDESTETPD